MTMTEHETKLWSNYYKINKQHGSQEENDLLIHYWNKKYKDLSTKYAHICVPSTHKDLIGAALVSCQLYLLKCIRNFDNVKYPVFGPQYGIFKYKIIDFLRQEICNKRLYTINSSEEDESKLNLQFESIDAIDFETEDLSELPKVGDTHDASYVCNVAKNILSKSQYTVFSKMFIENNTATEIAEQLNITSAAVSYSKIRFIKKIKTHITTQDCSFEIQC